MRFITRKSECKISQVAKDARELPVKIEIDYPGKHSIIIHEMGASGAGIHIYVGTPVSEINYQG